MLLGSLQKFGSQRGRGNESARRSDKLSAREPRQPLPPCGLDQRILCPAELDQLDAVEVADTQAVLVVGDGDVRRRGNRLVLAEMLDASGPQYMRADGIYRHWIE